MNRKSNHVTLWPGEETDTLSGCVSGAWGCQARPCWAADWWGNSSTSAHLEDEPVPQADPSGERRPG